MESWSEYWLKQIVQDLPSTVIGGGQGSEPLPVPRAPENMAEAEVFTSENFALSWSLAAVTLASWPSVNLPFSGTLPTLHKGEFGSLAHWPAPSPSPSPPVPLPEFVSEVPLPVTFPEASLLTVVVVFLVVISPDTGSTLFVVFSVVIVLEPSGFVVTVSAALAYKYHQYGHHNHSKSYPKEENHGLQAAQQI